MDTLTLMPDYTLIDLLLLAAATLWVSHVVTATTGPGRLFIRLRDATRQRLAGLFDCIWCVSVWVALVLFFSHQYVPGITWILAIAGAALMLRSYTGVHHG